jgi:hypothetical protein
MLDLQVEVARPMVRPADHCAARVEKHETALTDPGRSSNGK